MLKTVYFSLFYPFLSYGIVVWVLLDHEKYLKPVFISQKKSYESCNNLQWSYIVHTSPLFLDIQNCIILKLEDIYRLYISFLPISVSTTLLQFILGIILLRSLNSINIIPEVPPVVTFFLLEKRQCNKAYALSVLME